MLNRFFSFSRFGGQAFLGFVLSTQLWAGSCPVGTEAIENADGSATIIDSKLVCALKGRYTSNLELDNSKIWALRGGVYIGNDNKDNATLTIKAGTKIIGQSGADFLVITRGSKIYALGTKEAPITMTSAKAAGKRTRGDWGGLIINGNAPINDCRPGSSVCEAEGEGDSGLYGGNNPDDNSGILTYLRVEFAGHEITPENELNGIAFQGVGRGTSVDYIQVHRNADDGVEFFGGTVNVKHLYLSGNKDDSLDWTSGWQGKGQFILVEQSPDAADNGIEADNLKSPMNANPRSNPTLANMTIIGPKKELGAGSVGILLRRGTAAKIFNSIVTGFIPGCLNIDNAETYLYGARIEGGVVSATNLVMEGVILFCPKPFALRPATAGDPWKMEDWFAGQKYNVFADPQLIGNYPAEDSLALLGAAESDVLFYDNFFMQVNFIGALENAANDWTMGWTATPAN